MLRSPGVAITAIVCGTLVVLGALAGVVYLAATDHGTEAIGALLLGPVVILLGVILGHVKSIKAATNGTNTRLLDSVLSSTNPTGSTEATRSD